MKINFSSLQLVENPFNWAYDLEDFGFNGWEIVSEGKQQLNDTTLSEIKNILSTTNLEITLHLPFSDLNLASLNHPIWREAIRQMKKCIERASDFIKIAVIHPGYLSPLGMQLPEMAWRQNLDGIKDICNAADEHGISIGIENMPNMEFVFGKQPQEIYGMIESIDCDNLGMTFDIGHANTTNLIDDFLNDIENIIHIHIHDNNGKKDEHLEIGKGNINWKSVFKKLEKYDGILTIEARSINEGISSLKYLEQITQKNHKL